MLQAILFSKNGHTMYVTHPTCSYYVTENLPIKRYCSILSGQGLVSALTMEYGRIILLSSLSQDTHSSNPDIMPCVCYAFPARILAWVTMTSSRGTSQLRDWTHISYLFCTGRQVHYHLGSPTWRRRSWEEIIAKVKDRKAFKKPSPLWRGWILEPQNTWTTVHH